jgi:hypothetical protein
MPSAAMAAKVLVKRRVIWTFDGGGGGTGPWRPLGGVGLLYPMVVGRPVVVVPFTTMGAAVALLLHEPGPHGWRPLLFRVAGPWAAMSSSLLFFTRSEMPL